MDIDQIKGTYKSYTQWKRILSVSFLILAPIAYTTYEDSSILQEEILEAEAQLQAKETEYNKAKSQQKKLPAMEKTLSNTTNQMALAKKMLPDGFLMNHLLEKTSLIAQEVGVSLHVFDPGKGIPSDTSFRYVELPIRIEVSGNYNEIAIFFDKLTHLETMIQIHNFEITLDQKEKTDSEEKDKDDFRENIKLMATADLVIFRSLSQEEEKAINQAVPGRIAKEATMKEENPDQKQGNKS
jgi:type IV pilus assembly protein PilO